MFIQCNSTEEFYSSCSFVYAYHLSMALCTTGGANYTITPSTFTASVLRASRYVNGCLLLVMDVPSLHGTRPNSTASNSLTCTLHNGMTTSMQNLVSSCLEWKEVAEYMEICEYQKALDKLEGLVVQWLFELTKMGLAGTG